MPDLVKIMLLASYYYGRVMGVINFEIELATGRTRITRKTTIYAASVTVLFICLVPILLRNRIWHTFWGQLNEFHEIVFLVVMGTRICCVFATLLSRWWQRQRIMYLFDSFSRIVWQRPQVKRLWRRGVISKCICGMLSEIFHFSWAMYALRHRLTIGLTLSVLTTSIFVALINIVISQYYFALLNVHGHYILLNEDLRQILAELHSLEQDHRRGVRELRSCELADRVDSLAHAQSHLQMLLKRMSHIFGIQALCAGFITQFSMVAAVYYTFLIRKHKLLSIDWQQWPSLVLACGACIYVLDIRITYSILFEVLDQHAKMVQLLGQYTTLDPQIDVRLQTAVGILQVFIDSFKLQTNYYLRQFESFELQLIRNPLELYTLGLYKVDRGVVVAMCDSMVTYALLLIQYDMKYF
ncbi:hypothetical protein KR222_001848 [Zaprionus bogoriensis]|nr:hypothetical protein KR222_001848 [Zaprionus bogoriensis]